jgi:hypothetical protein
MVTNLQHIKYKSFDKKRYELNDIKGKNCITRYLKSIGHTVQEPIETMRIDLESVYEDTVYYHEVEMKHMWTGEWPEVWQDVHIPYRKKKLIDRILSSAKHNLKFTYVPELKTLPEFYFYIIRSDCKQAWKMNYKHVMKSQVVEVPNRAISSGEYFYKVLLNEAELIHIK